jgi:hypothetical protein
MELHAAVSRPITRTAKRALEPNRDSLNATEIEGGGAAKGAAEHRRPEEGLGLLAQRTGA